MQRKGGFLKSKELGMKKIQELNTLIGDAINDVAQKGSTSFQPESRRKQSVKLVVQHF